MIPQIIVIVLVAFSAGISAARHGKKRKDEDFWISLISGLLLLGLLWWGGFFDVFVK